MRSPKLSNLIIKPWAQPVLPWTCCSSSASSGSRSTRAAGMGERHRGRARVYRCGQEKQEIKLCQLSCVSPGETVFGSKNFQALLPKSTQNGHAWSPSGSHSTEQGTVDHGPRPGSSPSRQHPAGPTGYVRGEPADSRAATHPGARGDESHRREEPQDCVRTN